jgi:lysyl-tRNA synthetase class 2
MATERVSSSCIAFMDYDWDRQNLRLQYKDGSWYIYHNVPNYVFLGLQQAPSKGKYVNAMIKGYPFSRG